MALATCGIVVARETEYVHVRVETERCENCIGCIKFNGSRTIRALGTHDIGEKVVVETSTTQLVIASAIVLGIPILVLITTLLSSDSLWHSLSAFGFSLLAIAIVMRVAFSNNVLNPLASKSIDE